MRVIVLTGADCGAVARLLRRIRREAPAVAVCGVLYQLPRPPKPFRRRLAAFSRNLLEPEYRGYVVAVTLASIRRLFVRAGYALLNFAHASRGVAQRTETGGPVQLLRQCEALGCPLHVTADVHSPEAITFVRSVDADIGVVWGTRLLKPALFDLPRLGSVNIHRKKVPEYRGSGPTGMWELLDRRREIGITIHRVDAELDAGAVLDSDVVRIERFDTLATLDRKVHVAGNDLLVRFLIGAAAGQMRAVPQRGTPREFRKQPPHRLRRHLDRVAAERPVRKTQRLLSVPTLVATTLLCAPVVLTRNWSRRLRGSFPIVVLRYGMVADSAKAGDVPLDVLVTHLEFLKRHYRIVSLDGAIALLRSGRVTAPTVALTFDGDPSSNLVDLRAALREMDEEVTLFVPVSASDRLARFCEEGVRIGVRLSGSTSRTGEPGERVAVTKADFERRLGIEVRHACFPGERFADVSPTLFDEAAHAFHCVLTDDGLPNWPSSDRNIRHLSRCRHVRSVWELELVLQQCLRV